MIDYQPFLVGSIRPMEQQELVLHIPHTAKAAVNCHLPVVPSTVDIGTGKHEPLIPPLMNVLGAYYLHACFPGNLSFSCV